MTRYEHLARAIAEAYPALPNRLQGIARFALDNPDQMALSTVAEIARAAGVPPSAVIRFANALGFDGFLALQRVYRERLVARSATYRERIESLRKRGGGSDERPGAARGQRDRGARAAARARRARPLPSRGDADPRSVAGPGRGATAGVPGRGLPGLRAVAARGPGVAAGQRRGHAAPAGFAAARGRPADRGVVSQLLAGSGRGRVDLPRERGAGDRADRSRGEPAREVGDAALRSRRQPGASVPLAGRSAVRGAGAGHGRRLRAGGPPAGSERSGRKAKRP